MNHQPEAVSELPPFGAALVDYQAYKTEHPTPPDAREIASRRNDARALVLPPSGAALVDYTKYDLFLLEPPAHSGTREKAE